MAYLIGVASDRGLPEERGGRARNEDNYLVCADGRALWLHQEMPHTQEAEGDGVLLAVFDGIGGHDEGHVASGAAAKVLAKLYQPGAPHRPSRVLTRYLREAHQKLHYRARDTQEQVRMGTTVVAAWLLRGSLSWVNIGDSRIYLHRGEELEQLTVDHTRNSFRLRDGLDPEPDGDHLAQGFIFGSRGLGHDLQLRIEDGIDNGDEPLVQGDVLLLCTDGLTGFVDDDQIADILSRFKLPQQAADRLVSAALAGGSTDNITALVVRVDVLEEDGFDDWLDDGEETVQF